jgi:DNA-binding NtrC family response regulator
MSVILEKQAKGRSGSDNLSVLVVEDSVMQVELYLSFLSATDFSVDAVSTGAKALAAIRQRQPEVVLLDLQLPDMDGLDVLRQARAEKCTASFVVMTANGSVRRAVEAMQAGAEDFLVKPFDQNRLLTTLRNQIEKQRLASVLQSYRDKDRPGLAGMIGRSLAMQAVYRTIEAAAPSKATVFITGETGTGKELCAEAIHKLSPRARKPFVAINCAAIPKDLLESEIFGHVAGAFTGASKDRAGAASQADGGTLFLDEICEIDFDLQAKLLRFIQLETFRRVGGSKTEQADIRFVCATNRDPLEEVKARRFREDLYYRLHVIPVDMPSLRLREDDVLLLAEHFLGHFAARDGKVFSGFDEGAREALLAYSWPGNVRELQNAIQHAVVLNNGPLLTAAALAPGLRESLPGNGSAHGTARPAPQNTQSDESPSRSLPVAPPDDLPLLPLWKIERDAIARTLEACGGDVQKAAVVLEISASTIYRKLQSWQKDAPA